MAERIMDVEETEAEILVDSTEEMERIGANLRNDDCVLQMVRFILDSVWQSLPEKSLPELYSHCVEREDNVEKVLWHFMAALLASKNRNPSCLCRFVKEKSYKIDHNDLLYRLLLVQIALELASNTRSCRVFILYVVTKLAVPDRINYLPDETDIRNQNDIIPYVLRLFKRAEELNKIGPDHLLLLKGWLEKKELRKAAQMVSQPTPLVLRYSENGGKYDLTLQKDCPSLQDMDSYLAKPGFQVPRPVNQVPVVKQCSEESDNYSPVLPNDSSKPKSLDAVGAESDSKDVTGIIENLQSQYKIMSLIADDQWPPVKQHVYVDLALITSNNRPLINDTNSFTRETIRGSVDDIYVQKESTTFSQVFVASTKREIILIDGRPGSGKSTLITKVTKDWAEGKILQNIKIFILVVLRQFKHAKKLALKDVLGEYFDDVTVALVEDMIRQKDGENVCIAFDGLDEYSNELFSSDNKFVLNIISGRDLKNAMVYMTSRPATSNAVKAQFNLTKHIEIVGFTEKSKNLFIDKQCGEDKVKAERLKNYLKESPNIDRMCYLPLHLAMVIFLHDHDSGAGKFLPSNETELYYSFTINTIYRDIKKRSHNPNDLMYDYEINAFDDLNDAEKIIFTKVCQLAFDATVKQKQVYSAKEVKDVVKSSELREASSLGLLIVNRASRERATPTATYNFIHLTHQEFLAAVHLVYYTTASEQLKLLKNYADKDYMWVVWKFFCGLHAEKMKDEALFLLAFDTIAQENLRSGLASLNMIHCAYESKQPSSCSSLLGKLNGVLNVKDIKLHPSDCFSISTVLVNAPEEARELDFSYCHFGPPGIHALVQPFKDKSVIFPGVRTLRLRARVDDQPIGYKGYNNLILLIKKLPNLTELRLYGNKLTTYAFGYLSTAISNLNQLQVLILSRNHLDDSTGVLLSIMLGQLADLQQFYISYNNLTDKGLREMKPGLIKCKKLEILGLRGTGLGEQSGDDLAEILTELPNLKLLELYQNKLGKLGLMGIIPGITQAESLEILSLVNNNIDLQSTDYGIASMLADCIKCNTTLKTLRLFYNSFAQDVQVELRTAAVTRDPELGLAL